MKKKRSGYIFMIFAILLGVFVLAGTTLWSVGNGKIGNQEKAALESLSVSASFSSFIARKNQCLPQHEDDAAFLVGEPFPSVYGKTVLSAQKGMLYAVTKNGAPIYSQILQGDLGIVISF